MDVNTIVGWVNIGAVVLQLLFTLVSAIYIVNHNHLEFNAIWGARLALVLTGSFWAGTAFMHSEVLWSPEDQAYVTLDPTAVPVLCRSYVVLKYGMFEPIFFLLVINIVKFTPGNAAIEDGAWFPERKNIQIFCAAFMWWLPYWLIQAGLVTIGSIPFDSVTHPISSPDPKAIRMFPLELFLI